MSNNIKKLNTKGEKTYSTEDGKIIGDQIDALRMNGKQFAESLEYGNHRSIYAVLKGDYSINESLITRIMKNYPQVNYMYLIGEKNASMFKQGYEPTFQKNLFSEKSTNPLETKLDMALQQLTMVYGKLITIEGMMAEADYTFKTQKT